MMHSNRSLMFTLFMATVESPWVEGSIGTWHTVFGDSIIQTEDGFSLYIIFEIFTRQGIRIPTADYIDTFESFDEARAIYKHTLELLAV